MGVPAQMVLPSYRGNASIRQVLREASQQPQQLGCNDSKEHGRGGTHLCRAMPEDVGEAAAKGSRDQAQEQRPRGKGGSPSQQGREERDPPEEEGGII